MHHVPVLSTDAATAAVVELCQASRGFWSASLAAFSRTQEPSIRRARGATVRVLLTKKGS